MALQNVRPAGRAANKMKIGESVLGYLVDIRDGQFENSYNLVFNAKNEDGSIGEGFTIYTSGDLKYIAADGSLVVGRYTQITRLPDAKTKKGMVTSKFEVAQDPEDTIAVAPSVRSTPAVDSTPIEDASSAADRVAAIKAGLAK